MENLNGQFETTTQAQNLEEEGVNLEFLSPEDISLLIPMALAWGAMDMAQQIKTLNSMARALSGEKVSPLVVQTRKGKYVYPHVTYLSKLSSFSPILALPHSGQGFSTLDRLVLRHPAVLSYEITVGEAQWTQVEVPEGASKGDAVSQATAAKVAFAKSVVKTKWSEGCPTKGAQRYKVGQEVPDGAMMYHLDYGQGRIVAGPRISKAGFNFVVKSIPSLKDEDFTLVGNPEKATRVKVQLKIHGEWVSTSEAEKFAGMLTKLCIDKMPVTETPADLLKGGILLYEDQPEVGLVHMVEKILKEEVAPCPLTDVGSGQETQKGAPTAEAASAWLRAVTGKGVLRKETHHEQMVNGKPHPIGWVVWDDDQFVEFREAWNKASIKSGIWARWVDDWMYEVLLESTSKKAQDFHFEPSIHGGWYVFHRTQVRTELAPLTLETSTQKENLSARPKGSMFWELISVLSQMGAS